MILDNPFKYFVKVQKSFTGDDGEMYVQGVASGTQIDRQGERMSLQVLQSFVSGLPLPLTDNHVHGNVGTDLGEVVDAHLQDDGSLFIKAKLDKDNPFSAFLTKKVAQGKKYAFSIEGKLKKAVNVFDRTMGAYIKEYQDIIPEAISVTTCPVYEPSFLEVVSKSFAANEQNNIINKLSNQEDSMKKVKKAEETAPQEVVKTDTEAKKAFTAEQAKEIGDKLKVDWNKIDANEFLKGLNDELEHGKENPDTNVTNDNPEETGKLALVHLEKNPKYYSDAKEAKVDEPKEEPKEEVKKSDPEEVAEVAEEVSELKEEIEEAEDAVEVVEDAVESIEAATDDVEEAVEEAVEAIEEEGVGEVSQEIAPEVESKQEDAEEEAEETQEVSMTPLEVKMDSLLEILGKLIPQEPVVEESVTPAMAKPENPFMKAIELMREKSVEQEKVVKSLTDKVEHLESLPLMKKTLARPTILKSEESADVAPKTVKDIVSKFNI